jgi:hypothetical protein
MARPVSGEIQVATYVAPEVADRIDEHAYEEGLSRSAWVRSNLIAELTRRSRAEQGLPERIEDPEAIASIAPLLDGGE